jgi:SPOR domain
LTFILPHNFSGGGVGNVPGILMKSNEQARGTPLSALAVKVTDGFFLVGLSNVDADRARNLQLFNERSWFDVPLVYTNQRRAIIAIEKGASGERAFKDAFAAWGSAIQPEPAKPNGGGYKVQVAWHTTESNAQAYYRALQNKYPSVLGSRSPVIERVDLGGKGYRVMVGPFGSTEEAEQFCGSLMTAGGWCIIGRN